MNRLSALLATPDIRVGRFDHPQDLPHRDPRREVAGAFSVNFVERGHFELHVGGREWRVGPGAFFVTRPGLAYRCRHWEAQPRDVCLSVVYSARFLEKTAKHVPAHAFSEPVRPLTHRLAYVQRLFSRGRARSALAAEALALSALEELTHEAPPRPYREHTFAWYAERVDVARERMELSPAEDHALGQLARHADMSVFHFARVFADLAGKPPHRYLRDLRLELAARLLRGGASVTAACFDSGFRNLSHFTRSFRRKFGVRPSRCAR